MADLRVTDLPPIDAADVEAVDPLLISDISASESKQIDIKSLTTAGVQLIDDATIPPEKLQYPLPDDSITGDNIQDNSIHGDKLIDKTVDGGRKIEDGTIDTDQLANGAVVDSKIERLTITGGASGSIGIDTITEENLAPGSVGASELQPIKGSSLEDLTITDEKIANVDGSKINNDSITAEQIADSAIGTDQLASNAVTSEKIATETIQGGENGDIGQGTITAYNLADNSVGSDELQPISGDDIADGGITVNKFAASAADRGLDVDTGAIGHTNSIPGALHNGITFDAQGHVTATSDLLPTDLPIATTTDIGGVSVPTGNGLAVSNAGELTHSNSVTGDTVSGIQYDDQGHIVSASPLTGTDLPPATNTDLGGVSVPGPKLTVDGNGAISHSKVQGLVADTYTKVTVDEYGHVTVGAQLSGTDIPEHSAELITSGQLPVNGALDAEGNVYGDTLAIADNSITARHLRDYATCLMQEENPGASDRYGDPHFLGRFWFRPSTSQLYVYSRGSAGLIWLPVGFGVLSQQNLRFAGTYNATDSTIVSVTQYGTQGGLQVGDPVPVATDALAGIYLVCQVEGNAMTVPNVQGIEHTIADWIVCLGEAQGWIHINNDASSGGGGGGGVEYLGQLLDVSLNDGIADMNLQPQPQVSLAAGQLLKYGSDGIWRNTSKIDCGVF